MNQLTITPNHPAICYLGHCDRSNPKQAVHSWPLSGLRIRVRCQSLLLLITSQKGPVPLPNYYDVYANGKLHTTLCVERSKKQYQISLSQNEQLHDIEIYRRTESMTGSCSFDGLVLYSDNRQPEIETAKPRQRLIEFYGDSISCGYGNEGHGQGYNPSQSNACMAFPALIGRHLNADVSVVAYSGEGIFRRFDGNESGAVPSFYNRSHFFSKTDWDYSQQPADAVVINLGTNDFVSGVPTKAKFVNAYTGFIQQLAKHHPDAKFFVIFGPNRMVDDWQQQQGYLQQVVAETRQLGIVCEFIEIETLIDGLSGSDSHPNLAQHRHMAEIISNHIADTMGW
ncbi:hypothetical protein K0504_14100 [Neiella marina]|uniref:Endoglucanase E n=1 Tax=Neiella holothuriorum TaxID=2870530 RepID=A0ABS7EIU4_9GAMM|nr:SGNH/GDSL hydrolase family protein [Neiella holothuriorum]MBW8192164.1 hypothetical protein [Neiella holothuriorum]